MIGVFDSGVGGLTVVRAILNRFPQVDLLYVGDTARAPYGTRSQEEIRTFALEDAAFLQRHGADTLVIGCHTAAAVATDVIRAAFPALPVVSVLEHGIEDALHASKSGHIAVLGTTGTAQSRAHERLLKQLDPTCRVTTLGLSPLVPLIEVGDGERPAVKQTISELLSSLKQTDVDVAILACTHFPLIHEAFTAFFGPDVRLIDPAEDLARTLHTLPVSEGRTPHRSFFFSSMPQADRMARQVLGDAFKPILCTISS